MVQPKRAAKSAAQQHLLIATDNDDSDIGDLMDPLSVSTVCEQPIEDEMEDEDDILDEEVVFCSSTR